MEYSVDTLVREARIAIDQNNNSTPLASLGDIDTLTLDEIIRSKVEDAARLVHEAAPYPMLDNGKGLTAVVQWESQPGYGAGYLMLPDDFLRLYAFRMSDWHRQVTEAIGTDSPVYAMQSSRYAGVRGNPQRPVVAIVPRGAGLALEFYSCQGGPGVVVHTARYIPRPVISDGAISLCEKLRPAVVYRIASMTAESLGNANLAAMLLARSNELAGVMAAG